MGRWLDGLRDARDNPYEDVFAPRDQRDGYPDATPEALTERNLRDFDTATDARLAMGGNRLSPAAWYKAMRFMYPTRVRRLERDIRWLKKHARKKGVDPEEVKFLL